MADKDKIITPENQGDVEPKSGISLITQSGPIVRNKPDFRGLIQDKHQKA